MIFNFMLYLGSLTLASCTLLTTSGGYKAAVVEFAPEGNSSLLPEQIINMNMRNYESIVQQVKVQGAHIVVFPEYGLTTTWPSEDRAAAREFSQVIPSPVSLTSPCETSDPESPLTSTIYRLSCLSKQMQIYLVANLIERENCNGCNDDNLNLYNTNVAFENGTLVARYRKFNLFGEPALDNVKKEYATMSYFDALGTRFGLITCFDILYETPGVKLLRDYNVTDVIFPTAWGSELPFLMSTQAQASYAYSNNVTLLAAGLSRPHRGNSGSGIYAGLTYGALATLISDNVTQEALVADVPASSRNSGTSAATKELSISGDDLTGYSSVPLDLTDVETVIQNCHQDLCCFVTYRLSPNQPSTFHYQFLTFDGITYHDGGKYANKLQVCGVVACANEDVTSCNQHFDSSNYSLTTTFDSLEIVGGFKSDIVWPNSFLSSSWEPLQPTQFQFIINEIQNNDFTVRFMLREPTVGIHTFALYSHDYEPYNAPSRACRTLPILVVFLVHFAMLINNN